MSTLYDCGLCKKEINGDEEASVILCEKCASKIEDAIDSIIKEYNDMSNYCKSVTSDYLVNKLRQLVVK